MADQKITTTEAELTNPHHLDVTLDGCGNITAKLSCTAPVGAPCRLWCDEGCESAGQDHAEVHELRDQGYCCRTVGWFDDSPLERYDGGIEPLRSGPVILTWDGDTYNWSYDVSACGVTETEVNVALAAYLELDGPVSLREAIRACIAATREVRP